MLLKDTPGYDLTGHILNGFISKWSEDHHVFIVTDIGIILLQYFGTTETVDNCIQFKRQFIQPNEYIPSVKHYVDISSFLSLLPQDLFYESLLDAHISADNKFVKNEKCFVVSASWSPCGIVDREKCILAVTNNYGASELAVYCIDRWIYVAKVTDAVIEWTASKWYAVDAYPIKQKYATYKKLLYETVTSCCGWSTMYREFCVLLIGHVGGNVTLWKINKYETYPNENIALEYLTEHVAYVERITGIHWIGSDDSDSALLLVGNIKGQVNCVSIDGLESDAISLGDVNDLWPHDDLIKVSFITSTVYKTKLYVVIIKGTFIICLNIDRCGKVINRKHLRVGNFNITDIQRSAPNAFLVLTHTGALRSIKIEPTENSFDFLEQNVSHPINSTQRIFNSMFASPNHVFWGIISYPCSVQTPLTKGLDTIKLHILIDEDKDPALLAINSPVKSLRNNWDLIDVIRYQFMRKKELQLNFLSNVTNDVAFSLYELKIYFWIVTAYAYFLKLVGTIPVTGGVLLTTEKIRELIVVKSGIERIRHLVVVQKSGTALSTDEVHSLRIIRDTLIDFREVCVKEAIWGNTIVVEIDSALIEVTENIKLLPMQSCYICSKDLVGLRCQKFHPDQRCSISLLQISCSPKYFCPRCDAVVHESVEENMLFCAYCDVPLVTNFKEPFKWEAVMKTLLEENNDEDDVDERDNNDDA